MADLSTHSTVGGYPLIGSGQPGGSLTLTPLATPAAPSVAVVPAPSSALSLTTVADSSSTLAATTYDFTYSWANAAGSTTVAPGASVTLSTADADSIQWTVTLPADVTSVLVGMGTTSGGESQYARVSSAAAITYAGTNTAGITASASGSTLTITIAAPSSDTAIAMPTTNTCNVNGSGSAAGSDLAANTEYFYAVAGIASDGTWTPAGPTVSWTEGSTAYSITLNLQTVAGVAALAVLKGTAADALYHLATVTSGLQYTDSGDIATTSTQAPMVNQTGSAVFGAIATFNTGITGSGSVGALTVPSSNLTGAVANSQLAGPLLQSLTAADGLSVTNPSGVGSGSYGLVLNGTSLSNGSSGVSLNVGNANTWNAAQAFAAGITGSGSVGTLTVPWGNLMSIPANVTSAASTATTNTFAAAQTFGAGITGSGTTGALTAGAGILNTANTWGAAQTVYGGLLGTTYNFGDVANWGSDAVSGTVSNVGTNPAGFFVGWNATNQNGEVDLIAFSPVNATYPGQFAFWANPTLGSTTVHRVFTINANASVLTANNTLDDGSGASTTAGLATFNAGIALSSGQTFTNNGTITGGIVNPTSGTVAGTWTANQLNIPGSASSNLPGLYFTTVSTTFVPGSTVGIGLVDITGFAGIGFFSANAIGIYNDNATLPGIVLNGTGQILLTSNTPAAAAGALSQENNGLFFGNGSIAQAIPVGGEYEVATLLLPMGGSGYNITVVGENSDAAFGTTVLINNLPENATITFEAAFTAGGNEEATYVGLWDTTAGILVSGSSVTTTSAAIAVVRSGALSLVGGHLYQAVAYYATSGGNTGYIFSARIVAEF